MKVRYTNFKKEFPAVREGRIAFQKWFYFERMWGGKLIYISVKHHQITLDFRGCIIDELTGKNN